MAKVVQRRAPSRKEVSLPKAKRTLAAEEIVADYRLAVRSRIASVISRREVLTGKAGFGISGEGKEVPQLAMAKAFREGDWRSGYYRDQTFMFAAGMADLEQFFAQLYAIADVVADPFSGGRQMVSHFASRFLDERGRWARQIAMRNSSADISGVAGQMPRALGLAYASKLYRLNPQLAEAAKDFSRDGSEVAFCAIGDAGTSQGMFWETMNAAAVLQVPLVVSVWDDGFGISVPREVQTAKSSISAALSGMRQDSGPGIDIHAVRAWDYPACCDTYFSAVERVRRDHVPALIHVLECTQPQGHSTSGSHERYKTKERLAWEEEADPIRRMREWMLAEGITTADELDRIEAEAKREIERIRDEAWERYQSPLRAERDRVLAMVQAARAETPSSELNAVVRDLGDASEVTRRLVHTAAANALLAARGTSAAPGLASFLAEHRRENLERYASHLYSSSEASPLRIAHVPPAYSDASPVVDGRQVLVRCFDANLARDPRIFVIGEDVGRLGDVNLVFEGLQAKHGEWRLTDTGIRETTILGQAIGAALRGLRPVCDIQYLDYLVFGLEPLTDDLATTRWRTVGGQAAPVVIRTKGHRLQGIWHTGSPMSMLLGSCRGVRLCVPRDMTRAAGFYNTLFRSDDPGIVIEVLNGYRLKERVPDNVGEFTLPLGVPEVLRQGTDVTLVTYGACVRLALEAAQTLETLAIDLEVVDVQTLDPFDVAGVVARSVEKTNALLALDEDVPGGASAYVLQQVLEREGAWDLLDAAPRTLTATASRSPYGTDGDYFTKPQAQDVVETVYAMMRERDPARFPELFPPR